MSPVRRTVADQPVVVRPRALAPTAVRVVAALLGQQACLVLVEVHGALVVGTGGNVIHTVHPGSVPRPAAGQEDAGSGRWARSGHG